MFFINLDLENASRFDLAKFMGFVEDTEADSGFDPLDAFFLDAVQGVAKLKLPTRTQFSVQADEGRPDRISYKVYGSVEFWWIVLMYNHLLTPEEVVTGMVLNLPSLDDISNLYFRLKGLEQGNNG